MDEHLGYESYERSDSDNYRNGTKKKKMRGNYGEFEIDVPQDRNSTFEPQVVKKRQKDISDIDSKIISMYARGLQPDKYLNRLKKSMGLNAVKDSSLMLQIKFCRK